MSEWESQFNNCFQLTQSTIKSVNLRIGGLRQGVARQNYVTSHNQNIKNSKIIDELTQQLSESLDGLVQSKVISVQEMQLRDQKLQRIKKWSEEIKNKLSMSEADIMNQTRDDLLRGGRLVERGETEETRAMSNEEMIQSFDTTVEQQDELLDELHAGIRREVEKGKEIEKELDVQDKMIDNLTDHTEASTRKTNFLSKKTMYVEKKSSVCCLYIVIILLIVLLISIIASGNFSMGYYSGKDKGGENNGGEDGGGEDTGDRSFNDFLSNEKDGENSDDLGENKASAMNVGNRNSDNENVNKQRQFDSR